MNQVKMKHKLRPNSFKYFKSSDVEEAKKNDWEELNPTKKIDKKSKKSKK